jgi:hypothetical protein
MHMRVSSKLKALACGIAGSGREPVSLLLGFSMPVRAHLNLPLGIYLTIVRFQIRGVYSFWIPCMSPSTNSLHLQLSLASPLSTIANY